MVIIVLRMHLLWLVMIIVALASCGPDGSCPMDMPVCPTTNPPSYAKDVEPIIQSRCTTCHSPGGVEPSPALTNYSQVSSIANDVYGQVFCNYMPQNGPLTADQRTLILEWVVCGAQNN